MSSINLISGGLDVQSIVDQLIAVESEPVTRMQTQTTTLQKKVSAFQSINTKLASLLDGVNSVLYADETVPYYTPGAFADRFSHSVFAKRSVTSSDENVITAVSSKGTASGSFEISVSGLARAESKASDNFADTGTTLTGTGTLVFTVGSESPVTVNIDSSNNTLQGIRDAINRADAGVTATIINDGSANPYRLVISSDKTGTANAYTVQDNLSGGQALNLTQKVAATNAEFEVNGIAVSKSSNTVTDVIDGVSFTLHDKTTAPVTVAVDNDVDGIVAALQQLVSAYNDVNSAIDAQSKYNADTKTAGILSGDATLRSIKNKIQELFRQSVANDFTSYSVLSQVGLRFNNDGSLTLDESKLRDAIDKDVSSVAALFLGDGAISDGRVTYNSQTSQTQAGTYGIAVTGLAQQGAVTGSRAVTSLSANEDLTITYGSTTTTVSLLSGDSLSSILTKINDALEANGAQATASDDGTGRIKIVTDSYGSNQTITVVSNQADADGTTGFGNAPVSGTGVDISGTINGDVAVGSGLTLTGVAGRPEEGLVLTIAQTTTGSYGTIRVGADYTDAAGSSPLVNLRSALKNITDPLTGPIHNATDALNSNIRDLEDRIDAYQARLDIRRELLTNEYSKADAALREMQVLQSSLSSQLSSLTSVG